MQRYVCRCTICHSAVDLPLSAAAKKGREKEILPQKADRVLEGKILESGRLLPVQQHQKRWGEKNEALLRKVASLQGDDDDEDPSQPFAELNHVQRAALGLGDMPNAILKESAKAINSKDDGGRAPLHHVCQRGDTEALRLLLHAGAHVDIEDDFRSTPLTIAAESRNGAECAKLLVDLGGCRVDTRDCPGRTALHYAAGSPNVVGAHHAIKYLLSKNAHYRWTNLRRMPLHFLGPDDQREIGAGTATEEEASRPLEVFLRSGARLDGTDGGGRRPVNWAIGDGKAAVLRVLIRAGAMLDGLDRDRRSILHYTAMYGNQDTIAVLGEAALVGLNLQHCDICRDTPENCLDLRKISKPEHWAQVRIESKDKDAAIRALFCEIGKRNAAPDLQVCRSAREALQYCDTRGVLCLLAPLIEQKRAWKKE